MGAWMRIRPPVSFTRLTRARRRRPAPTLAGLTAAAVCDLVCRVGARPTFPRGAPAGIASLAADCWRADPAARPSAEEIAARLEVIVAESS
jgi:hypothetical protein